ncbi:MAG: hypothetical protein ACPLKQ_03070 [Candidatus Bathyarchaeales archaeon]
MLEAIIRRLKHVKSDKRGISNVLVVLLSLILVVVIVANLVLWNYQMNQLDWEKTQEKPEITNVGCNSQFFTSANEYLTENGEIIRGTYADTRAIDDVYETFREGTIFVTVLYAHQESQMIAGASHYLLEANVADALGTNLVISSHPGGETNVRKLFGKFVFPLSGVTSISASAWTVYYTQRYSVSPGGRFEWGHYGIDVLIRKADGSVRKLIAEDVATSAELTTSWSTVNGTYTFPGYVVENQTDYLEIDFYVHETSRKVDFYLRIDDAALPITEQTRIEGIQMISEHAHYSLSVLSDFLLDVSPYPVEKVKSVEVHVRFRASDPSETWILKAYNWLSGQTDEILRINANTYFQNYVVTLQNWQNYASRDGIMRLKLCDEGPDANQTTIDVDFFGVRIILEGAFFAVKNSGPSTIRLVSIWINNATIHARVDVNYFINSGETEVFVLEDVTLPSRDFVVKIVTDKGNIAVFTGG